MASFSIQAHRAKELLGITTQLHQYGVHGNPVQPSGKGGTATKRVEVTKHLDESLLRQVFCFSHIFRHPQTHRIYKLIMQLVECGEGLLVAALCTLNERVPSESSCWFSALSGITSAGGGTVIGVADVIQVATVISGVITRVLFGLSDSKHDRVLTSRKTRYLLKILMTGQFCTLAEKASAQLGTDLSFYTAASENVDQLGEDPNRETARSGPRAVPPRHPRGRRHFSPEKKASTLAGPGNHDFHCAIWRK